MHSTSWMNRLAGGVIIVLAITLVPVRASAGAPTTSIMINGPGLPSRGVFLTGRWPGGTSFIDDTRGPAPPPTSDLPRYVLAGRTADYRWWYTVLFVWDSRANRALVYLPGPGELGYQINYCPDISYEKRAGKWYYVSDRNWSETIHKALPRSR